MIQKKLNLAMLLMVSTLEPKFLKIGFIFPA